MVHVRELPFDSEIFGFGCGELVVSENKLSATALEEVLWRAYSKKIRHLCAKVPAAWVQVGNALERKGFLLKVSSLDLTKKLGLERKKWVEKGLLSYGVTVSEVSDRKRIIEITNDAFSSGTRFHFEFPPENVVKFYAQWICNLLEKPDVTVLVSRNGRVIDGMVVDGYISISDSGNVGLFAVAQKSQGKGIGNKLLKGVSAFVESKGSCKTLNARTESINYPALAIYCKNGFSINRAWHVFHRFE